jgi:hypothetical protein
MSSLVMNEGEINYPVVVLLGLFITTLFTLLITCAVYRHRIRKLQAKTAQMDMEAGNMQKVKHASPKPSRQKSIDDEGSTRKYSRDERDEKRSEASPIKKTSRPNPNMDRSKSVHVPTDKEESSSSNGSNTKRTKSSRGHKSRPPLVTAMKQPKATPKHINTETYERTNDGTDSILSAAGPIRFHGFDSSNGEAPLTPRTKSFLPLHIDTSVASGVVEHTLTEIQPQQAQSIRSTRQNGQRKIRRSSRERSKSRDERRRSSAYEEPRKVSEVSQSRISLVIEDQAKSRHTIYRKPVPPLSPRKMSLESYSPRRSLALRKMSYQQPDSPKESMSPPDRTPLQMQREIFLEHVKNTFEQPRPVSKDINVVSSDGSDEKAFRESLNEWRMEDLYSSNAESPPTLETSISVESLLQ